MKKNIKQLSNKELYNNLIPIITDIILKYDWITITNELIINVINIVKEEYQENMGNFENYFKKRLESAIHFEIKKQLNNEKKAFNILNNYLNNHIILPINYDNALEFLKKLSKFLSQYSCDPNLDILINLINNNANFNNLIKIIVNTKYSVFINVSLDKIFNYDFIIQVILAYCMINNIEIYSNKNALEDITDYDDSFSVDSIKQYLKEIGEYPLLNKEDEAELFARLENGESELFNYIVNCNLRLVVSVARRFTYHGLDILDLIQEGNMGLMTAVEKFDYKLGYKFSTYATYWIERSIRKALAFKSRNVRIPLLKHNLLLRIVAIQKALINKLGREPKIEEIAEEMDLPVSKINELINLNTPVSLNSIVDADSKKSAELGDFVASDIDLEADYINESLQDEIQKLLLVCNLNKREIDIITSRFGLFGNKKLTLEELGSKYNLTRERIRQIEKKVIIKFIKNQETDKLAVYTDNPEKAEENLREKRNEYWHKNIDTSVVRSVKYNKRTNNCEEIKGDNFMKKRTKNTIYDYFEGYSKENVDKVIELLPPEEKYILKLWENEPIGQSIYPFFNDTLAKIRRKLKNPHLILTVSKTPGIGRLRVRDLMEQDKNRMLKESIKEEISTKDTPVEEPKKDNVNMLNNLRSFSFAQMLEVMSVKEAVIVALRFGYIDGKCFETERIAEFLGITPDEVRDTSRKILLLYKEQINSLLDSIIDNNAKANKSR